MYLLNRYDIVDQRIYTLQYNKDKNEIRKYFNQYLTNIIKKYEPLISYEYKYNDDYTVCTIIKKTLVINKGYFLTYIDEIKEECAKMSICYFHNGRNYSVSMLHTITYDDFNSVYDEVVREIKKKIKKI